jgi:hypothetical protein
MRCHLLGDFTAATIFLVLSDTSRTKGVIAHPCLDARSKRPPADHAIHIGLRYGIAGQGASFASCGSK